MNVNINTRLTSQCVTLPYMNSIQIGTTPCFTFDLDKKIVDFKDISQLQFIFKQGCDYIKSYNLYDEEGNIDPHFSYDQLLNIIRFVMTAEETLDFVATYKGGGLVDFEVVVIVGDKQIVFADEDSKIFVIDSLYRRVIEV